MENLKFKLSITPEYFKRPPKVKISINDKILFNGQLAETTTIEETVSLEDDSTHKLNFTLYEKIKYDTIIEDGKIVKDTVIKLDLIEIDDIDLSQLLSVATDKCYYIHDGSDEKHTFHDTMGVNGTSTIEFTTPFYQWLLETL